MQMEPLHFLTFPIILGASTPGGTSSASRQNGAAGGKGVALLWKGKLSPGRREGDTESRPNHLLLSPWHIAPLHLPLVGQNCWPHMASGFSASVWLRVAEPEEKGDKEKGEKPIIYLVRNFPVDVNEYGSSDCHHCVSEDRKPPTVEPHHGTSQSVPKTAEEGVVHILSMGSKALMLQVWADFSTGSLTFR